MMNTVYIESHPSKPRHFKKIVRYNSSGHAHELTFSCYNKNDYLTDPKAGDLFLSEIQKARDESKFLLWAYVLMPDHVHLLICPTNPKYDISRVLNDIKGRMAKSYRDHLLTNDSERYDPFLVIDQSKKRKVFRFWQPGGGFDRNLWNPTAIHDSLAYIEANPVRKRLVKSPADYRWSSAYARATNTGVIPDVYSMPVALPDPQHQSLGKL